ncbi:MAG: hypothetical protein ACT4OZ_02845 [Gemmatimonadota bacterium]
MQWSSSRRLVILIGVACTSVTTRYFVPSRDNPNYRPLQAVPVLQQYVRLQCGAFRTASGADSGWARFSVEVDSTGQASRSQLLRPSGDELLDDVFGTVSAQLTFPRDSVRRRLRVEDVRFHFRCGGDSAIVRIDARDT